MDLKPIKPKRISDQVFEQIRELIRRATEKDILAIEKSLSEMEEDVNNDGHISTSADAAFHMAITFATKNPVLIHLMRNFYDFLFIGINKNLTHMYQRQGEHENVLDHHRMVYEMIRDRKPKEAGEQMRIHINYVQEYFRKHHSS